MTQVGVVFPRADLQGGVERVAWDLLNYLGDRYPTVFFGTDLLTPRSAGVRHQPVVAKPSPGWLAPNSFRRSAARAIAEVSPDHVVSFGANCPPGDVFWVQSVHRAWLNASTSVKVRGWLVPAAARKLKPWHRTMLALERLYFTRSDPRWILCTSQREVDDVHEFYGVDRRKLVVMPNGYDGERFSPRFRSEHRDETRARLGLGREELALLFVANELHRKGFEQTLRALAAVGDPSMTLHVVGRMALTSYASTIAELGLTERVRYHGPTSSVERFHAAADALVLPTQYEPFGLVIIEAMASGLPVVTTALAGAADAIVQGQSGLLQQDPHDLEELTSLLQQLRDPDRRDQLGSAAAVAARPYEWQRVFGRAEQYIVGSV